MALLLRFFINSILVLYCHSAPDFRKNVPNIMGSVPKLGELYNGKTDQLLGPLNLYNPGTIKNKTLRYDSK